ncbi:MAG: hypothetical protein BWY27_00014 [Bacteroidetes bacterium ADurb.Bin234]|nr:MAG: hypothetical protein BWY27_00014 [Bacteroidetes bacterium ADurb.Bin234]
MQGSCSNIEFYACHIKASTTTTTSPYSAIYRNGMSGSNSLSDIRIIKNNISGGYYNIYWYYGGGGSSYMGNNCIIDSNVFTDAYYGAIYSNNGYTNFNSISYNNISCRSQNQSSNFYGMYFSYYNNIDNLIGNKIYIRNNSISYAYPIYVYYYNNHTNNSYGPILIANNEIIVEVGNYCEGGINIDNYSQAEVINNSIYVSATTRAYGLRLYTSSSSYPIVAKNNNIFTLNATNNYPLYIEQMSQMPYITLDYNNYASNGNYVGLVGAGHLSLASLRSATLQDTHSVAVQPNYIDLNTSLELLDYSGIVCARHPAVMTDINGLTRKMLTPMGAYTIDIYEGYNITANAIVEPINTSDVFCYQDYASVRLAIQNTGSYLIDFSAIPLFMHVEVTGAISYQYDTILMIGGVAATQRDTVTVTDFLPVSSNGIYNIKVWTSLNADTLYDDDTVETIYSIDKIVLPYSINFNTYPYGLILKQNVGICQWSVQQGSGTNPVISPSHGTGRLEFNSSIGKGSVSTATLQPINLRGTSNPKLEFWYAHDNAPGRDYTDVKISIDGGYTYTSILNIQRFNPNYSTPGFAHYNVDLSAYATYSCVIIAFEAGSFGGGNQNIDSICVISSEDLALNILAPEQYDFVACELNNQTLAVTLTNLTSQDFNFTTKPTQIDVMVSGAISKQYTIHLTSGYVFGDSTETFILDTAFDFSTNGTYNISAVLKSIDDNKLNDTARTSRIINVDAELVYIHPIGSKTIGERVYPTVSIKNNGNMPIHNIPLHLLINHNSTILETIYIVLDPGDSVIYTFVNPYVVPTVNEAQPFYMLNIRTEVACDGVGNNNSKSDFYNVILEKYIDLSIAEVIKPNESVCDTGNTMVYPIVKIINLGTQTANNITLYISIDSAGTLLKSYSESISFISGQDSIEYTCLTAYRVPNFGKNYTLSALLNVDNDINTANNTKEVNACAIEKVNINEHLKVDWILGQNIPNPAKENVSIPYYIPKDGSINFKVMSITGQILYSETIEVTSGNHLMEFNTHNLSDGVYYYSMDYEGQRIVKIMSIQK